MDKFKLENMIEKKCHSIEENIECIYTRLSDLYGTITSIEYLNNLLKEIYYSEKQ